MQLLQFQGKTPYFKIKRTPVAPFTSVSYFVHILQWSSERSFLGWQLQTPFALMLNLAVNHFHCLTLTFNIELFMLIQLWNVIKSKTFTYPFKILFCSKHLLVVSEVKKCKKKLHIWKLTKSAKFLLKKNLTNSRISCYNIKVDKVLKFSKKKQ
jgi:hypothetical protein